MITILAVSILTYVLAVISVSLCRWWISFVSRQIDPIPYECGIELQVRDLLLGMFGPMTIIFTIVIFLAGVGALLMEADTFSRRIL
jgi:hypothetical protein